MQRIGLGRYNEHLASQAPLTATEIRRTRAIALVYPVVAALAVLTMGVSASRLVLATVFFSAWVVLQMLVLSPARRRQVLGMSAVDTAEPRR